MAISEQYQADAAVILSHRYDNGGDLSLSDSFGGPGAVPPGMCGGCPDAEDVSAFSGHAVPGWRLAV